MGLQKSGLPICELLIKLATVGERPTYIHKGVGTGSDWVGTGSELGRNSRSVLWVGSLGRNWVGTLGRISRSELGRNWVGTGLELGWNSGSKLGRNWVRTGSELGRNCVGTGSGLGRNWVGTGSEVGRNSGSELWVETGSVLRQDLTPSPDLNTTDRRLGPVAC